MRKTTNINLSLYDQSDTFNITGNQNSLNSNFEIIDEEINALNNTNSIDEVKNEVASLKEEFRVGGTIRCKCRYFKISY